MTNDKVYYTRADYKRLERKYEILLAAIKKIEKDKGQEAVSIVVQAMKDVGLK